jgi:hypothetical protein
MAALDVSFVEEILEERKRSGDADDPRADLELMQSRTILSLRMGRRPTMTILGNSGLTESLLRFHQAQSII